MSQSQTVGPLPHTITWNPRDLPTLRAAYSDRTSALMAYLAAFAYDASIEASPPLQVPPLLRSLGFNQIWSFHNGLTNGWAYIAVSPDIIVLSFRGTQTKKDWEIDFQAALIHPDGADGKLLVHCGFYRAFRMLADGPSGLGAAIAEIKNTSKSDVPIYIAGHSLGGALAQIAAAVFGDDRVAACYTFGSPRVGNSYFDLWVKVPSYRVINFADIVPQVPLAIEYRHSGDPRYLPDHVSASPYRYQPNILVRIVQFAQGIFQFARARSILSIADHATQQYCEKLDQIANARPQSR